MPITITVPIPSVGSVTFSVEEARSLRDALLSALPPPQSLAPVVAPVVSPPVVAPGVGPQPPLGRFEFGRPYNDTFTY